MTRIPNRNLNAAAAGRSAAPCQGPWDDQERLDLPCRPADSRLPDFDDDDHYGPSIDDDEDYEDFRWEEVPGNRPSFPPGELWDDDDWD